jgi:hypothetical protein
MDRNTKTKKGMKIRPHTKKKVEALINDFYHFKSLPGDAKTICIERHISNRYIGYMKEIEYIKQTKYNTIEYYNPNNHTPDIILKYVLSRYEMDYKYIPKYRNAVTSNTQSDLVTLEVDLPASMKAVAEEAIFKNQIKNLQSDLKRRDEYINTLQNDLQKKYDLVNELTKKKSIFTKIKTLFQ